ncbi:hypothetical protein F8388_016215 [Cannabis sativa]|uniref:RNase H type-1 domain-containing protein n=1 Tax=Cannabis sativa TaxID=3483 RepID=A0A7J6DY07_CANSA|nr:hypothetical protein F8388_016215 [Cannabis sativa]
MGTVRFRATVDVDKPLFSGFFLKREAIKDLWLQYKYEKLPKLCLKCGIMSREQKFCFKPPTITKDPNGNFFPLFGSWMKHEESARWPFSPDLPKWFQDWIIQKRLAVDPKFKDQMKMANSLRIADSWEARESRRQLPGKWRMVEQVVEEMPETEEVRVCHFPMVTLPGVGDVCPFEDTANLVVPKGPDVMPPLDVLTNKIDSDNTQSLLAFTNDAQSGETVPTAVLGSPSRSQAQVIPWPSNDLWSMGFKTLSGLGTIDKFMREPSIFNPIMGIEDCRSLEYDFGPKKRKALDGIVIEPKNEAFPEPTLNSEESGQPSRAVVDIINTESSPASRDECHFSHGLSRDTTPRRKRGRPVTRDQGKACCSSNPQEQKPALKRRGRPPKDAQSHGPKTFSLKRQARNTVKKRQESILGSAGGLALCWKIGVDCKIQRADKFQIQACISSDPPDKPWILMGVYGPPIYAEKEGFWKEISEFVCNCTLPVLIIEDLNGTLLDSDCLNYSRASNISRYSFDFRRAMQRSGLIDLGFNGVKFTWFRKGSSSSSTPSLKRARLDRALALVDWRLAWPNAIVSHLTVASSDHNPIILDTCGGRHCSKPQFKYELMWERDPRVFWVVKTAWMTQSHRDPMVNMYRKIKATKEHLRRWNKTHFRKLATQISEAQTRLKDIEGNQIRAWFDSTDATNILNIGLPALKQEDSWQWLGEKRGTFSIKSAYYLIIKHRQCGNWSEWLDWVKDSSNRPDTLSFEDFITGALCIFESIWKVRNDVCHGAHQIQISEAIRAICVRYKDHHSCIRPLRVKSEIDLTPLLGWMTCCTDVSIDLNLSVGAAVFRDDRNRICGVFAACFTATEPTLAEAHTLAMAGHYVVQNQFMRVGFLCDNAAVVSNFLETNTQNLHLNLAGAASKFRSSTLHLQSFQLSKIGREQNFMAHNAAKWARINNVVGEIDISSMPPEVFVDQKE